MPPDVVMPVRPGASNEELRFALRSLANIAHGRVWFVGFKPSWVTGVEFIEGGNSAPHARANLYRNLLLACQQPGMSDDIIVMNDDIYFISNHPQPVPTLYRGPLAAQIKPFTASRRSTPGNWWQQSLLSTQTALLAAGFEDPRSYELHTPFPCNRHLMFDTLSRFAHITPHNPPQWRTLYGVTNQIGGLIHRDCKALRPGPIFRPYHSTDDLSWRYFRARFLQMFPEPSPYEIAAPVAARSLVSVAARQHLRSTRRVRA